MELSPLRPRSFSQNVRHVHAALSEVLNDAENEILLHSLCQYKDDHNVKRFVTALKSVLNSPRKREVYSLLRRVVPVTDQSSFDRMWHYGFTESTPTERRATTPRQVVNRRTPNGFPSSCSLPERLNYASADSGIDIPHGGRRERAGTTPTNDKYPIKRLVLKRAHSGFGFSIRGGAEHGVGLYVSAVDKDSAADREGLLPGDHILFVNETQLDGLTHPEAVRVIKQSKKVSLTVRSVGHIPSTFIAETTYKWIDTRGRRVSPPPDVDSSGRPLTADGIHKSDLRLLGDDDERKVSVFVEDGIKLGLLVRGGSEYGLGIFIADVDPNGAAERAGLKSGDQIMDVNGRSFLSITHKEAIKMLKSTKNMIMTLKDVGRLPLARTTHDKTKWIKGPMQPGQSSLEACPITDVDLYNASPPSHPVSGVPAAKDRRHTGAGSSRYDANSPEKSESIFHHGVAGNQVLHSSGVPSQRHLITEQARQLLNENELGTMTYYMNEYSKGFIPIRGFVLALFDLLNTSAKMSLLSEVRGSVSPKDLEKFDDLVVKREIEIMKSQSFMYSNHDDSQSVHSYGSAVSSLSGKGSVSSKSSAMSKEARNGFDGSELRTTPPIIPEPLPPPPPEDLPAHVPDSTPASPPPAPEALPPGLEAQEYDTYEATLTFSDQEIPLEIEGQLSLPDVVTIDSNNLQPPGDGTVPSPTPDGLASPISASTPRHNEKEEEEDQGYRLMDDTIRKIAISETRTKAEVTVNEPTDNNVDIVVRAINSSSDEHRAMVNGDISRFEKRIALGSDPGDVLCNGDFADEDSANNTLTNGVSVEIPRNEYVQVEMNNNQFAEPKPTIVSRDEEVIQLKNSENSSPRIITKPAEKISTQCPAEWKPEKPVQTNGEPDWDGVQISYSDDSSTSEPVLPVSNGVTPHPKVPPPVHRKPAKRGGLVEDSDAVHVPPSVEEPATPTNRGVHDLVQRYSQMSDHSPETTPASGRRGSSSSQTRKSWDGVKEFPALEPNESKNVSRLSHQKRGGKSISDSSILIKNLPKEEQKDIQMKRLASQELFDLHQKSKTTVDSASYPSPRTTNFEVVVLDKDGNQAGGTVPSLNSQDASCASGVQEIEVEKTCRNLGLSIEGGSDTAQKEIRVKSVKEGEYSAYQCGKLRPGQVILEVDGISFTDISNGLAILRLRQAHSNSESNVMKLLVK